MSVMKSLTERVMESLTGSPSARGSRPETPPSETSSSDRSVSTTEANAAGQGWHSEQIDPEKIEENRRRSVSNRRVGKLALVLAKALREPPEWQEQIRRAARLHDIGKLWVPDEILNKPGPLTDEEYEEVKKHTVIGASLLSRGESGPMRMAGRIARSHHERWDGEGYPDGLEGEKIPLSARIVAVADTFDAMTQDRPYRDALPVKRAFEVIEEEAGAQFDPRISEAALRWRDAMATLV